MAKTKRTKKNETEVQKAFRIKVDDVNAKLELFQRSLRANTAQRQKLQGQLNRLHEISKTFPMDNIGRALQENRMKKSPNKRVK